MPPRLCERMSWMFYGSINFSGAQRCVCRPRHNNVINVFRSTRHLLLSFFWCRLNRMTLRGGSLRNDAGRTYGKSYRVSTSRILPPQSCVFIETCSRAFWKMSRIEMERLLRIQAPFSKEISDCEKWWNRKLIYEGIFLPSIWINFKYNLCYIIIQ